MRFASFLRLAAVACILAIATENASACKCGGSIHGKSAWEAAKLRAQDAAAAFEGVPEKFEIEWATLNAKNGELVPAEYFALSARNSPRMLVTFRVQRAYKGDLGQTVQVRTGLGGGDCGARFAPGLTYLVFAYGPTVRELGVSLCSPGEWIGDSSVAADLRFLRKEHPVAGDLALPKWSGNESAEQTAKREAQQQRTFEMLKKQYEVVTGKICGTIVRDRAGRTNDAVTGMVSFFSTKGYSPFDYPSAQVNKDGTFCSGRLGPGKYFLFLTDSSNDQPASALYYPGVSNRNQAIAIEVAAGQIQSSIVFKVPTQKTYSVRGFISAEDKAGLSKGKVYVALFNPDGNVRTPYLEEVNFDSFWPLPKVKYFSFERVLPGRYFAYVIVPSEGWFTRKIEVEVSTHMKFISLELIHKK